MVDFNLFDGLAVIIILFSALFAYSRGAVREVMSVVGWIVAAFIAYLIAPQAVPVVVKLPVVGELLSNSCELAIIVAFTLVFAITLAVSGLITMLLSNITSKTILNPINKGLGLVFGVFRGILVVTIILMLHEAAFSGTQMLTTISESQSASTFHDLQQQIQSQISYNNTNKLAFLYQNVTTICTSDSTTIDLPTIQPTEPSS